MLRVLILGTGGMASNHAAAFAAIPGVQVVAGEKALSEITS